MLGKPIVMAKNTGFDEIIEENDIGIIIDYSTKGLKEGINQILERKKEWELMAARSQQLYKDKYSWRIMEQKIVQMYEQIYDDIY